MTKEEAKSSIAYFMHRAYERGLTTSTGGNISMRYGDLMLITPSGKDKNSLTAADIAEVELLSGKNLTPEFKLSIETEMHRAVYLEREDVNTVVHSHPTCCCLFSASPEEIDLSLIAESWYLFGNRVEKAPYRLMGTMDLADIVREYIKRNDALLLEKHGALAVGKTLLQAFDRIECLEQAAKMTYMAKTIKVNGLTDAEKLGIDGMKA